MVAELQPAPGGYPIKMVRDRTAAVINATGEPGELFYGPLPPGERARWLRSKLMEEATEYLLDQTPGELSDVYAVVEGLAAEHGLTMAELGDLAAADRRGGFLTGQMMFGRHAEFDGS